MREAENRVQPNLYHSSALCPGMTAGTYDDEYHQEQVASSRMHLEGSDTLGPGGVEEAVQRLVFVQAVRGLGSPRGGEKYTKRVRHARGRGGCGRGQASAQIEVVTIMHRSSGPPNILIRPGRCALIERCECFSHSCQEHSKDVL